MNTLKLLGLFCAVVGPLTSLAAADVLNMGGTRNPDGTWNGLASLETVRVGNPGNAADMRYNLDVRPEGYGRIDYVYRIAKYEITAGQYTEFLNAVARTDTYRVYKPLHDPAWAGIKQSGSPGSYTYSVPADYANRPMNCVNWGDAARFANWLHNGQPSGTQNAGTTEDGAYTLNGATSIAALMAVKRNSNARWAIPSDDEWYKAAYHKNNGATGDYYDYPTSSDSVPSKVLGKPTDPGNNATYSPTGGSFTIVWPYYRTEVGEHENSASPYGTFDQAGNVQEWTESSSGPSYRKWRGGGWRSFGPTLHAEARRSNDPTWYDTDFGFRVVQVPEPGTMAILAFGGIGMLVRRRGLGR